MQTSADKIKKEGTLNMAKLLEAEIMVVRGGEAVPYETLTAEEKGELGKKLNQQAIRAVARLRGYDIKFFDAPPSE